MNDDDLRRLIAGDIATHSGEADVAVRLEQALAADQQMRVLTRAVVTAALVAIALLVLSAGYWLAAMALPPLSAGDRSILLWAPIVVPGALVVVALRAVLLALGES